MSDFKRRVRNRLEFIQWYNRKLQIALKFEELDHQNMLFRKNDQHKQNLEQELKCLSYGNIEKLNRVSQ